MAAKAKKTKAAKSAKAKGVRKDEKRVVVWALDPFSDLKDYYPKAFRFLRAWSEPLGFGIEPTYVLSPDGLNWSGEFTGPWMKKFEPMAQEAFSKIRASIGFSETVDLVTVGNREVSLRSDAKKLVDHAKARKADLVCVTTHARRGLNRVLMGSFAETIVLMSKTPVLLLNPETEPPSAIKRVVFSTDLSRGSKKAFTDLLKHLKGWGAEVVLYHKLPDPIEPIVQSGVYMAGGGWISLYQYMEKEGVKRRKICEDWAALGKKMGVAVSIVIDDQPGFVAEALLKQADAMKADLVVVTSHVGRVGAVLMGSVARDVARRTKHPLLVYRS